MDVSPPPHMEAVSELVQSYTQWCAEHGSYERWAKGKKRDATTSLGNITGLTKATLRELLTALRAYKSGEHDVARRVLREKCTLRSTHAGEGFDFYVPFAAVHDTTLPPSITKLQDSTLTIPFSAPEQSLAIRLSRAEYRTQLVLKASNEEVEALMEFTKRGVYPDAEQPFWQQLFGSPTSVTVAIATEGLGHLAAVACCRLMRTVEGEAVVYIKTFVADDAGTATQLGGGEVRGLGTELLHACRSLLPPQGGWVLAQCVQTPEHSKQFWDFSLLSPTPEAHYFLA